jgi:hypothetical protein
MALARFCTAPSRAGRHDPHMDAVSIVIGIAMFAILYALIYGIDRV